MVTEYVDGGDLDNLRQGRGGRVRPEEAVGIMVQVLEGLEYAHGRGIVHRDLKPGNILLARERGRYVAKIADFGLARARGCQTITGRGEGLGTLAFMAPEQILDARGVDQRADVFGVGATLYNLVTGEFVYDLVGDVERDAARVAAGAVVEVQRRRRNLPQGLVEVINRATRADPGQRYPSAQAMREALARAL
jgi:serine/threonine-protein kinase